MLSLPRDLIIFYATSNERRKKGEKKWDEESLRRYLWEGARNEMQITKQASKTFTFIFGDALLLSSSFTAWLVIAELWTSSMQRKKSSLYDATN